MTQEEIRTIANKLEDLELHDLAAKFLSNPEGFDFSVLESYPNFVGKYKNVDDFKDDKYKIMGNIYLTFDGKMPTQQRFEQLQSQYPWLNKDELQVWFDKTNKYREMYKKEGEERYKKAQRIKETKDWGWRDFIASDYEKQRYINEPEKALFGKQAPEIGEAPETRAASMADLGTGTVGAVADFIPYVWWLGPTVRTGRDAVYNLSGSDYSKDWKDIGLGSVADFGINRAAKWLPNARKEARIARQSTDAEVARTLAGEQLTNDIKQGVSLTNPMNVWATMDDKTLMNAIKDLPESPMKNELMEVVNTAYPGRPLDRGAITEISQKYTYLTLPEGTEGARSFMKGNWKAYQPFAQNEYTKQMSLVTPYNELTKKQKASYLYNKLVGNINKGKLGQVAIQEGANLYGRGRGEVKTNEDEVFERQKEYFKKTRGEDWLKYGKAFAPKKQQGDAAWEAYKELMEEHGIIVGD